MGLLGDIGRSNVGQTGRSMYNDVLRYGQMERQGNLDSLASAKAISDMEANKAEEQRKATEFAQKQEQYAEMSRPRPIQGSIHYLMLPEEDREEFVSMMQKGGYVDENGMTSHIRKNQFLTELGKTEDGIKLLSRPFIRQAQMAADKASTVYSDAITAGDPDKIATAEKKLKAALLRYETLDKGAGAALKSLAEQGKADAGERKMDQTDRRLDVMDRDSAERNRIADRRADIAEKSAAAAARKAETKGKELGFGDREALRGLGKQLPKTKITAQTAEKNVQKIDRMLDLIDKGAGGVRGELLAKINKAADVFRVTSPEDAKYNTLKAELRGFAGQLRLQLGLVGQTSDRDVAIMYESAGGNSPAESQKAIIEGYRQGYIQDITNYNSDAEAYSEYSDVARDMYKPIKVTERKAGSSSAPSRSEWMKAAKAKNPSSSDAELGAYYDKKYGGK